MTDTDFNGLMKSLGHYCAEKAAKELLAGNDTQCFTTEQYMEKYFDLNHRGDNHRDGFRRWWRQDGIARMHLTKRLGMREVKPDIWSYS